MSHSAAPLGFQAFDADNHYYEAEDAFTRHIDPQMAKRCMQWADVGGKRMTVWRVENVQLGGLPGGFFLVAGGRVVLATYGGAVAWLP